MTSILCCYNAPPPPVRLGYFERRGLTMTPADLGDEVKNHYKYQLLQEVYVLILGLDVLGNPYGLIKDFAHGVSDFFYEPYLVREVVSVTVVCQSLCRCHFVSVRIGCGNSTHVLSYSNHMYGNSTHVLPYWLKSSV